MNKEALIDCIIKTGEIMGFVYSKEQLMEFTSEELMREIDWLNDRLDD